MKSILSTRKLTPEQKQPLWEKGIRVTEYDSISISPIDFKMPEKVEHAIFTSKNTVEQLKRYNERIESCFCVGKKTKNVLEEIGFQVIAWADYGKDLANIIVKNYSDRKFTFFCGNRRRHELPNILKENHITFEEIQVYKTALKPKKFEEKFDGILFFSPSGVESFCLENNLQDSIACCIGYTTATEAKTHTNKIVVAEEPTIESLIDKVQRSEL
ncbi:MAG TPA: uroporphyrinogen-III synthase [Flavobacteriaceae bacterium]|nr:uroporphyrinogen-III synthase [Flavobacteriaceae bacterium]